MTTRCWCHEGGGRRSRFWSRCTSRPTDRRSRCLLNPGGGVLGGDRLRAEIDLGPGAHASVATPSATKVYRCPGPPAVQHTFVSLAEGATLEYVPHHVIPHAGAALEQSLHVDLGPRSRLILYDGLCLGRVARGERWAFRSLASEVRVTDGGRPLYWDRLRLTPDRAEALSDLGGAEGCAYLGTVLLSSPGRADWEDQLGAALGLAGASDRRARRRQSPLALGLCREVPGAFGSRLERIRPRGLGRGPPPPPGPPPPLDLRLD